jgi:hypothetical protein
MLSSAFHLIANTVPPTHNTRWAWHVGQYPRSIPVCTEAWHCPQINAMQHASKTVPLNRQHMSDKSEVLHVLNTPEVHTCPCTRTASKALHALPPMHSQQHSQPCMPPCTAFTHNCVPQHKASLTSPVHVTLVAVLHPVTHNSPKQASCPATSPQH